MAGTNNTTGNAGGATKMAGKFPGINKISKADRAVDAEFTKMRSDKPGNKKSMGSIGKVKDVPDNNKKTTDKNVAKGNFKPFTKKG